VLTGQVGNAQYCTVQIEWTMHIEYLGILNFNPMLGIVVYEKRFKKEMICQSRIYIFHKVEKKLVYFN